MFQLESVLLLALDVVRGPYIHCCAPKGVTDSVHMLFQDVSAMNNNQNVKSPTSPASSKFKTTHTSNNNIIHSSSDTHPSPDSKTSRVDPNRPQSNLFISGRYNNVLVPRGEFCRRALWLYSAESGQLLLYYAEDIAGERYARKNLRYSVCFVCKVADKMTTVDDRFIREHIQPYGTLLTVIAEELRDAEVRYGYVSRELHQQRSHSPPSSKTEESTRDLETEAELDPQFPSSSHTGKHLNHFVTSPHTTNWVPLERFFLSLHECILRHRSSNRPFRLRLSDTHFFYVKAMAPLQPLTQLYLDTVAVCISAREMKNNVFQKEEDEEEGGSRRITTVSPSEGLTYVVDSMDIVVQAVLKLIDNKKHRTVADICFALSFHTTVTLDELYHAAAELYAGNPHPTVLREGATVRQVDGGTPNPHHEEESCNTHNSNAGYNEKGFPLSPHGLPGTSYSSDHSALNSGNTHSNSKHNSNNQTNNNTIIVQLAPLTHTPFLNFTSNNTTSLNINNESVSSAARSGTTQNAEEPCHVKVALTSERGLLTFTKMAPHTNPHHSGIRIPTDFTLSVELPVIWEELYRTVVEALQHLSMSRLVRLFLHKSKVFFLHAREAKYSHTALFREEVLIRRDHSARKFLGKFLLNEMEKEERYRRERSRRKQPWQEGQAARQHSIQLFDPPTGQTVYEIDPEIGEGNDMYFCLYYNITHKQNTLSLQVRSQKMQEDVRVGKRMNKAHKNKDHRFLSYTQYYDSSEEETEDPGYDSLGESMPTSVSSSAGTHHYRHSPQPESHPPDEEEHSVSEESSIVHDHQQSSSTLGVDRVEAAASAAVCALSKFSNTSLYAVQEEMKLVYGDGGWADNVYIALLQIGLINNWLEETERL